MYVNNTLRRHRYVVVIERILFFLLVLSLLATSVTIAKGAPIEISQEYLIPSTASSYEINTENQGIALEEISLYSLPKINNAKVTLGYISTRPIDRFLIARSAYQYFSLRESKQLNASIKLRFGIPEEWVENQGLILEQITLYQFNMTTDTWSEVPTKYIYGNKGNYYYEATPKRFGYYVISDKDRTSITNVASMSDSKDTENQTRETSMSNKDGANEGKGDESTSSNSAPDLEQPLPTQKESLDIESLLIPIIAGVVLAVVLIGGSTYIVIQARSPAKEEKKQITASKNLDLLNRLEQNVLEKKRREQEMKQQIHELEPKIAERFATIMRSKGYSNEAIRETLIQNDIDNKTVNRIIGM